MFGLLKKAIGLEVKGNAVDRSASLSAGKAGISGPGIEVAACTVLLEAAYADYNCSDDELDHVVSTMKDIFGITDAEALELVEMAHKEREQAVDVYSFTRAINEKFPTSQKLKVLEALWKVMYSDDVIDKYEDALARMVVQLLRLERKEALEAKLSAKKWAEARSKS